jgi:hypothetical protein
VGWDELSILAMTMILQMCGEILCIYIGMCQECCPKDQIMMACPAKNRVISGTSITTLMDG